MNFSSFSNLFSFLKKNPDGFNIKDEDDKKAITVALNQSNEVAKFLHKIYHVIIEDKEVFSLNLTQAIDKNGSPSNIVDIDGNQYCIRDNDEDKLISHLICDRLPVDITKFRIEIERNELSKFEKRK